MLKHCACLQSLREKIPPLTLLNKLGFRKFSLRMRQGFSGVSRISARGCLRSGPIRKAGGGGGGGLYASARSLLPFDVLRLIKYKSIIFNNVSTYGRGGGSSTRSTPPLDTPLGIACQVLSRKLRNSWKP